MCASGLIRHALAKSISGLYKAEVIHRKSWKSRPDVELATLSWVDWYNNRRLQGALLSNLTLCYASKFLLMSSRFLSCRNFNLL
ncbi:hypothetical protein BSW47_24865 [Salmonella enterica subsp. enterica serovar Enteritidis]|nr:hypothetical protein LFZ36_09615 [Salmonella enterica subsp. enterica serovar Ouakam str. SA20034636]OPV48445.1 hypothetical protein BSW47_24865 [Salmonella enterica subsp. enterica serovar Enteritidis]